MLAIYDHNGNKQLHEYYDKHRAEKPETHFALERKYKQESNENTIKIVNLQNELTKTNELLELMLAQNDALYSASIILASTIDLTEALTQILSLAIDVIGAKIGSVMILDPTKN